MRIPDGHINFTTEHDIQEIAKPFFDISCINYFFYTELFKSGCSFCLSTNARWLKSFYEMQLYKLNPSFPAEGYHLCATNNPIIAANAKEHFNIDNYLIFTKEYKNHYMMAGFGTSCKKEGMVDYYLSNRDVLDKFITYFRQQAEGLIDLSRKPENLIVFPEYGENNYTLKQVDKRGQDFLKLNYSAPLFSKRELDCIQYLLLGDSMREIGGKLQISPRTVETYIENIKNKLGCNKKSELIKKLLKNGFAQILLDDEVYE